MLAEYAIVFVRAPKERLVAAERLVCSLPGFLGGGVAECDLHHCAASGYLAAVLRGAREVFRPEVVARIGFWAARVGARGFLVGDLSPEEQERFRAELRLCERTVEGTLLGQIEEIGGRFLRALGSPLPQRPVARLVLGVDLDGPGGRGIHYRPESRALLVAGALAPPRGDQLAVAVREHRLPRPVEGWATVVEVRGREEAGPGKPAGFVLRIEGPAALHELLAARARDEKAQEVRAAPRFPVKAPVAVRPAPPRTAAPAVLVPPPPPAHARIEYATEQELAKDWIENLSQGGAFVRTSAPHPIGTEVLLDLALPDGARLEPRGVVAYVGAQGMGVRFELTEAQEEVLAAAIARISARPRRAIVVDDDALVRRMYAEALVARGFEVISASSGEEGLHLLMEELLTLDLLLTDIRMPGISGEELVRLVRKTGGEADLAIVAVSGRLEPGDEAKLEEAGASAVLDKSLGPEMIAQAADAVIERLRLAHADAA